MQGLRDQDGQIVISEREAAADIKKIERAVDKLRSALKILSPSSIDDTKMRGETRDALEELLHRTCSDIARRSGQCDEVVRYINAVVENYRRADSECAASIGGAGK